MSLISDIYTAMQADGLAVPATFGAVTTPVVFDLPDLDQFGGFSQSREYSIRLQSVAWPLLKHGDAITVDGVAYTVREVKRVLDGAEMIATLSKN